MKIKILIIAILVGMTTIQPLIALVYQNRSYSQTRGRIAYLPGGDWVPSQRDVENAFNGLRLAVHRSAAQQKRRPLSWDNYYFQYYGVKSWGKRYVYINAFCRYNQSWKSREVKESGGGSCYFKAFFNVAGRRFTSVQFNN